ncbi:hypothetical protein GW796_10775 [archaeon]|nr:hypothetical protein [archaeon]NCQ52345.1 hypothetical protein [archaeon]
MFIRPIGRNSLQKISNTQYFPDLTFKTEKEFIDYIINEPIVNFFKITHFGFKKTDENGFLASKKCKIKDKEFNENTIFVLDKNNNNIKETHWAGCIELISNEVIDNIKNKRF